ncbi:MAG: glycosyltransferase family 4 protein [Anaerolineales bacterium]|nr:glycosyltransferase family 4 protein [Anaerolineales bacterium]
MSKRDSIGILFLSTPYASPVPARHSQRLISYLAPLCHKLIVVGDQRIDLSALPAHVQRLGKLPTLHRREELQPAVRSTLLWFAKLAWIWLKVIWAVMATWRQVQVIVIFLDLLYTPAFLLGRLLGKKIIYFEPTGTMVDDRLIFGESVVGKLWVVVRRWVRGINRHLAHILVIESWQEIEQGELKPYLKKVRLAPPHIDLDIFRSLQPFEHRPRLIGFVGRLSKGKGIMELLQASALLRDRGIALRIVGEGELHSDVLQALRQPEHSHVEYVGWADQQELIRHLSDFRLLVLPTAGEGMSNIVMEAMACGTPVLATSVGGIPDLIKHQETGFILPDRTPESIAQAIQEALSYPALAEVARAGQEHIRHHYTFQVVMQCWQTILEETGENKPSKEQSDETGLDR